MGSKLLRTAAFILLVLMPYSTVLSFFSPYVTNHSFQQFLWASLAFAAISFMLAWYAGRQQPLHTNAGLFFLLGMIVAPPLMIGMPETSEKLLERTAEEHFRYGMLLLATGMFAAGFLILLKNRWSYLSAFNKLIVLPLLVCVGIMVWDNYSSYRFSYELENWIANGNKAADFFPGYNFNELIRTMGRSMIFILVPWLSVILLKQRRIEKWQTLVISLFCFLGILFFILFNFVDVQFYFPFMIPAVALAPAYWLGLCLLRTRKVE